MKEYIIEFQNPNKNYTEYSIYRGETKEEAENKFKRDFPEYIIIETKIHNGFKDDKWEQNIEL